MDGNAHLLTACEVSGTVASYELTARKTEDQGNGQDSDNGQDSGEGQNSNNGQESGQGAGKMRCTKDRRYAENSRTFHSNYFDFDSRIWNYKTPSLYVIKREILLKIQNKGEGENGRNLYEPGAFLAKIQRKSTGRSRK